MTFENSISKWNRKLTASRKPSTRVMLFIITTALSRVASVLNSFIKCCLRFNGHGNILACSSTFRTSLPFSLSRIQRGSVERHIFKSSAMDDTARSIASVFSSSINRPPSGKWAASGGSIDGSGIISDDVTMASVYCLEYMFMSKSKDGGMRGAVEGIPWIGRPVYLEVNEQTCSNC